MFQNTRKGPSMAQRNKVLVAKPENLNWILATLRRRGDSSKPRIYIPALQRQGKHQVSHPEDVTSSAVGFEEPGGGSRSGATKSPVSAA